MPADRPLTPIGRKLLEAMLQDRPAAWGDTRVMPLALREIRHAFGDHSDAPSLDQLKRALRAFFADRTDLSPTQVKYVCYGVTVPRDDTENGERIIDDRTLFDTLFDVLRDYETQERRFRQCYQGLLQGYFGFRHDHGEESAAQSNWIELRHYLNEQLPGIHANAKSRGFVPVWLDTLSEHDNLLTDDPCSRYADKFETGKTDDLRALFGGIGIESNSWVWDEVVMAYVRSVCERGDAEFHDALRCVVPFLNGKATIKLPQLLAIRATAAVVTRYAQCGNRPEHDGLRDACVALIGNPWLDPTAWRARVGHEPARQMVEGWLKRRLIKDFFEVLAKDGAADLRRLKYWLKWEPEISDMWFVLGEDAQDNRTAAFNSVRKRMAGRDRLLTDAAADNNAFVMRIGSLLVIEFGVTGNACYVFDDSKCPVDLDARAFSIRRLKNQVRAALRLSHNGSWEYNFDARLREALDRAPTAPRDQNVHRPEGWKIQEVLRRCAQHGISYEDNRWKKGALWVLLTDPKNSPRIAEELVATGFKFKEGSGYWLK
jgi:hypothetical protein